MTSTATALSETDRSLVTVETVTAISSIENADAIEAAKVRGWTVVIKKGEVAVGDRVLYFEIDSFLPLDDERFAFLAPRGSKTIGDVNGHVLKTARLRGVYSQGLILPLAGFPELDAAPSDADLASLLAVTKYEEEIPDEMAGKAAGPFPVAFAPKTSAERVQNLTSSYPALRENYEWLATEKLDGTSTTYVNDGGVLRVAGRSWEWAAPETPADATAPWIIAAELDLLNRIPEGYAIQGELFGSGVLAKNRLKIDGKRFLAFSVLKDGAFLPRHEWPAAIEEIGVPVLDLQLPPTVEEALAQADGLKSVITPGVMAEGIVWHNREGVRIPELNGRTGMKAINNKWLVKHG